MNDRSTLAARLEEILQELHDRLNLVAAISSTSGQADAIEAVRDLRRIRSRIATIERVLLIEAERGRPGTAGNPIPLLLPSA